MPNDQGYDVFISYAHADNEIPQNATIDIGWVTALADNLNTSPNVRKKKLFIDHQLKPGDAFSDDLISKVKNSKLLVILLSQNYIDSEWCGNELERRRRFGLDDSMSEQTLKQIEQYKTQLQQYENMSSPYACPTCLCLGESGVCDEQAHQFDQINEFGLMRKTIKGINKIYEIHSIS